MSIRAEGARHLATPHQSKERCWEWWALKYGHAQPVHWFARSKTQRALRIHLTPIHFERWGNTVEIGLCLGRRTLYVMRHR